MNTSLTGRVYLYRGWQAPPKNDPRANFFFGARLATHKTTKGETAQPKDKFG